MIKYFLAKSPCGAVFVVGSLLVCVTTAEAQSQKLYWTQAEAGTVHRADLTGTGSMVLSSGIPYPNGVSVDVTGGHIYLTHPLVNTTPERGRILRSSLDGTGISVFAERVGAPLKVAVAHSLGKVYWTVGAGVGSGVGRIIRSNLDGGGIEELPVFGSPFDIVLDELHGHMYWTDYSAGRVRRANLDGSSIVDLAQAPSNVQGLAIDFAAERMYWIAFQSGTNGRDIATARLDGSLPQILIPNVHAEATGLDVDSAAGKLYWSEAFGIKRSNLDGSGIELVVPRNYEPFGRDVQVVVIPEPVSMGLAACIFAFLRRRPR